jgi:hypothetical protein
LMSEASQSCDSSSKDVLASTFDVLSIIVGMLVDG